MNNLQLFDSTGFFIQLKEAVKEAVQEHYRTEIKRVLSVGETCNALGVSRSTLQRWTKDGRISPVQGVATRPRYSITEINRFLVVNQKMPK